MSALIVMSSASKPLSPTQDEVTENKPSMVLVAINLSFELAYFGYSQTKVSLSGISCKGQHKAQHPYVGIKNTSIYNNKSILSAPRGLFV